MQKKLEYIVEKAKRFAITLLWFWFFVVFFSMCTFLVESCETAFFDKLLYF